MGSETGFCAPASHQSRPGASHRSSARVLQRHRGADWSLYRASNRVVRSPVNPGHRSHRARVDQPAGRVHPRPARRPSPPGAARRAGWGSRPQCQVLSGSRYRWSGPCAHCSQRGGRRRLRTGLPGTLQRNVSASPAGGHSTESAGRRAAGREKTTIRHCLRGPLGADGRRQRVNGRRRAAWFGFGFRRGAVARPA